MRSFPFRHSSPVTVLLSLSLLFVVETQGLAAEAPAAVTLGEIAPGPFKPEWSSLTSYQCPEWFRDAKFGIWAHWGSQCEPEHGDWYANLMYKQGDWHNVLHLKEYGHPSVVGFKDIIQRWKATDFDPDKLLAFYKANGAKYFVGLAVHCDNFDNWDSKYQSWNSVKIGPKKDLIGGWEKAARKNGLRFGVSVHNGGWTWSWYEVAQGSDTNGPMAGIPYDGKLTKADGKGKWWEGLDPQDLYAQNHIKGAKPDEAYCTKFFLRTKQLWDDYKPDLIYFDEDIAPMHRLGVSDTYGLNLYAHFYNSSIQWHGTNEAVINAKNLNETQRRALVYDIERGKADQILPQAWQTDTCIGWWHYNSDDFKKHSYKSAASVIRMLADIVSKNGNLLLSVPLQRGGQPDADEIKIVSEIGDWLRVNGEAIYSSRPWKVFGEGPSTHSSEKGGWGGAKDFAKKPFEAADFRFTTTKDGTVLYAIELAPPTGEIRITSLAQDGKLAEKSVKSVELLGSAEELTWKQEKEALVIQQPKTIPNPAALAYKIQF